MKKYIETLNRTKELVKVTNLGELNGSERMKKMLERRFEGVEYDLIRGDFTVSSVEHLIRNYKEYIEWEKKDVVKCLENNKTRHAVRHAQSARVYELIIEALEHFKFQLEHMEV